MDETSAAAEIGEERAENVAGNVDKDDENNEHSSAKDAADRDELFCCRNCGEAFSEEAAYLEHRLQHPPQNMHLDSRSDGLFDSEKDNEALYFCSYCALSFVEMSELHLHMKDHEQIPLKGSDINPGATKQHAYECADCGKSYTVIGHFLNHQRSHRQPSKSVFHDLEHLKKKSFQCESCGRNYSRASALDAHRRCHQEKLVKSKNRSSGETVQPAESPAEVKPCENPTEEDSDKVFKCLCGKGFSSMMRLKTHQRFSRNTLCSPEEMKQKPKKGCGEFYCSECNKAFNGHIALFNHQRWHANHSDNTAKRFPCEECGKEFMTLTFYYRHQRTAHSDETPSKSFQHQVCQLQKKAFECKDCGLKFSRASALQSHRLQHTDVFRETEKAHSESTLPSQRGSESEQKVSEHLEASVEGTAKAETIPPTNVGGGQQINEMDEEMESYEPGDFNVQVISASESEDEGLQETNPDLELLCESDQDIREDAEVYPGSLVSKPDVDLKIIQIDFAQSLQCPPIENEAQLKTAEERFGCPECYRWFNNPSSLRVHRMWHTVRRRRHQNQGQSEEVYNCNTFPHETQSSGSLIQVETSLEETAFTCSDCDQVFTQLPALLSHQLHHPKRKQFQCPHCTSSYLHAASLYNHLKTCATQKRETISVSKKEYNPKKTLLGPKIYHCEQCGKGFWSLGAFSHHKQNQMECVDLRLRKGVSGSLHSNGRSRSTIKVACPVCGRKFRHKGIMALHMRKHENGDHKCEICGRSFRLFSSLLRHEVVHSDLLLPPPAKSFQHQLEQLKKNTYACPDCGKLFSRAKALQFHMKSHGYETGHSPLSAGTAEALKDLQCVTCFAHFTKKSSLRAHQKLCRSRCSEGGGKIEQSEKDATKTEGMDTNMPEVSKQINEGGSDAQKMEQHLKGSDSGSNKWKYQCKICNKSFSTVGAMNIHKRTHIECNKGVAKSNSPISLVFKITKKDEQSKGLIHCSDCGRRFTTKSALGSHKRLHRNEKCSSSSLEDALSSVGHKTEDEGFKCQKCGKYFFNRHVLQRHWIFNPQCLTGTDPEPNADLERNGSAKQFSCPECDQTFGEVSLLASHYEKEHRMFLESGKTPGTPNLLALASEQTDVSHAGTESLSSVLKTKTHQCPLCSMTFEKARGLRAHKWQAHSEGKKSKMNLLLRENVEQRSLKDEVEQTEHPVINSKEMKEVKSDPVGPVLCLDSGTKSSSAEAPHPPNRACLEVKQKTETAEATDEVLRLPSRLSENTVKYLFKCDKCGKAFQTEEQLESHKIKAKSRPYCCALCCHGFWTESQLQQHLAWHDQVRCRLPSEVRLWLSSAVTSKPFKPNSPNDGKGKLLPPPAASEPTHPRPCPALDVQALQQSLPFADSATETQSAVHQQRAVPLLRLPLEF
ncbi:zinc finger protein 208 isoform X1 [Xiphophorus couchianus]|uniref:zinc finger protein 208 isoform X1 n=1 Tax=Xiphophorus couchianus TaxID=32473 RepID=UPI00101635B4|nr:zinc finger protein 208-like isoform X1 [Xiphophorus couchianus]